MVIILCCLNLAFIYFIHVFYKALFFIVASSLFTIKLFNSEVITEYLKGYFGGDFYYVDLCNTDDISIIEIYSMIKECEQVGFHSLHYKFAKRY